MYNGDNSVIPPDTPSFGTVLDTACGRLWETHIQYAIRRIKEMEGELDRIEKDLDSFAGAGSAKDG